jgi:hypothetical protein
MQKSTWPIENRSAMKILLAESKNNLISKAYDCYCLQLFGANYEVYAVFSKNNSDDVFRVSEFDFSCAN